MVIKKFPSSQWMIPSKFNIKVVTVSIVDKINVFKKQD